MFKSFKSKLIIQYLSVKTHLFIQVEQATLEEEGGHMFKIRPRGLSQGAALLYLPGDL